MANCCGVNCTNRAENGWKMFTIPRGKHPFAKNRRKLWLQAIKRADWGPNDARSSGTLYITSVMIQLHLCLSRSTFTAQACTQHSDFKYKVTTKVLTGVIHLQRRYLALQRSVLFNKRHFYPSCFSPIGFQWCAPNGRDRRGSLKDWVCLICSRWLPCPYQLIGQCAPGVKLWFYRTYHNPEK